MDAALMYALQAAAAHLIEKLKQSKSAMWSWIGPHTDGVTKTVSAVIALITTTIGITFSWVVDPATNLGTLTIGSVPTTFEGWMAVFLTAFTTYMVGKGYYLGMIKPHNKGVLIAGDSKPEARA